MASADEADTTGPDVSIPEELRALRREFHRHPEPAWCEFYTTARIVEELRDRPVDVSFGETIHAGERKNVPDSDELAEWRERALEAGADAEIVSEIGEGYTGAVATFERGEGPTVGLRVDIDGLPIREAQDGESHVPAAEGFRSEREGYMHACGHDAHATFGIGTLDRVIDSEFEGTLKVFFQPGEEQIVGGEPMVEAGVVDDVEYLFAVHVGLDHPTGEVIAGMGGFLAVSHFHAEFDGEPAHAGGHPEEGRNTVQAAAAAIQNLYGIPRHGDGATRVNAGVVGGGTATNIIPEETFVEGEVRGETTELMEYMDSKVDTVVESAAAMHEVSVETERLGRAPSAESDETLVELVGEVAPNAEGVTSVVDRDSLGGSEDATFMMQRVQDRGGVATYVGIGTDHPGGHHTSTFDVDERSLAVGVNVLGDAIRRVSRNPPAVGE